MIPPPLAALALALASFRLWRLLSRDDLPPIVRARNRALGAHFLPKMPPFFDRPLLADWLACAWCSGLWIAAAFYAAWLLWPHAALYAAAPLALSAAVGLLQAAMPD